MSLCHVGDFGHRVLFLLFLLVFFYFPLFFFFPLFFLRPFFYHSINNFNSILSKTIHKRSRFFLRIACFFFSFGFSGSVNVEISFFM